MGEIKTSKEIRIEEWFKRKKKSVSQRKEGLKLPNQKRKRTKYEKEQRKPTSSTVNHEKKQFASCWSFGRREGEGTRKPTKRNNGW